jgi:AcrR family transcriptional regulator
MKPASLFRVNLLHPSEMLPQREFKQARSAATYESLLAAASRVFGRRGFEAAQTPEIAAEAGVSTGAFYRYFADKRAIFLEVAKQHLQQSHDSVLARLTPDRFVDGEPRQIIDVAIGVLCARIKADAPFERVFLAVSLSDPDVQAMRADYEARGCQALAALIAQIVPAERVPNPVAAARVISLACVEVAGDLAGLRPRTGPPIAERAMLEMLREMIYRVLFLDGDAPKPSEPPRIKISRARRASRTR